MEFSQTAYSATEGSNIRFEIVLVGMSEREVTVEFSTEDGSALGQ